MFPAKVTVQQFAQVLFYLFHLISLYVAENKDVSNGKTASEGESRLVCPPDNIRPVTAEMLLLHILPCTQDQDCPLHVDLGFLCCKAKGEKQKRCRHGVIPPKPKPTHAPLLGVIQRHCPEDESFLEILQVQTCRTDDQCWPRICCNEYCRTPALPQLSPTMDGQTSFKNLRAVAEYLQCTPPPLFDFFSKPCTTVRDCFPHVCCQEREKKVCRPAKKSILPLLATFFQEAGEG